MITVSGVYDPDLNFLGIVADLIEVSFQETRNDSGQGTFKCHDKDPGLVTLGPATMFAYDNIVVLHDTVSGHYFPFVIERRDRNTVSTSEGQDLQWTITGRGALALLDDAVVYPEHGLGKNVTDHRNFNFASIVGNWYQSSEWVLPVGVAWADEPNKKRRPKGWPDPAAEWIWNTNPVLTSPPGIVFFRSSFTLGAGGRIAFFCTGDNRVRLYVDGEEVLAGTSWLIFQRFDIDLDAGDHIVGIWGQNITLVGGGLNPGAVLFSAWTVDVATGRIETVIRRSEDVHWLCRPYGSSPPGWDPGDIMSSLLAEARARTVDSIMHVHLNVTTNQDSAGQTWGSDHISERTFQLGDDYLSVLSQIGETSCDFRMRWNPAGDINHKLNLELFKHLGVDRSIHGTAGDPVMLRKAFNAVEVAYSGDSSGVHTALLVRTSTGWVEEVNSGAGGRRKESFLSLGSTTTDAEAVSAATATFAVAGVPQETITARAISRELHKPFLDFSVGDYILAPNDVNVLTKYRVESLALSQDAEGNVTWAPTLNDQTKSQVRRMARWLKSMAKGTVGGRVASASPTYPLDLGVTEPDNSVEIPFSLAGPMRTSTSSPWTAWTDLTLVEVIVNLATPGSSDTQIDVLKNGISVGSITLAASALQAMADFFTTFAKDVDTLQVSIVTPGSGASDLTVQARLH